MKLPSQDKSMKLFEGIHFHRIEARHLVPKKRQVIYFKYSEFETTIFKETEYYIWKVKEAHLQTKDGEFKGDCEISLPVVAFNKMVNRSGRLQWLYEHRIECVCLSFKKNSRHRYDALSLILG
jgi:hypothetical protein